MKIEQKVKINFWKKCKLKLKKNSELDIFCKIIRFKLKSERKLKSEINFSK